MLYHGMTRNCLALLLLCFTAGAFSSAPEGDKPSARRVQAHLRVGDKLAAVQEAQKALAAFPRSILIQQLLIQSLAKAGYEKECIDAWKKYEPSFKDERQRAELMEEIAWGILEKGLESSSLSIRGYSMLGATLTQDVYAVEILKKCMRDSNSIIRAMAVEFSSYLNDHPLQAEVLRLLEEEKVWDVRLEAIQAAGEMKLQSTEPKLKAILSDERTHLEEKIIASTAIVNMRDDVQRSEIYALARSNRAGLRLLACQMAAEFDRYSDLDLIVPLVNDSRTEVRIAALNVLGLLRPESAVGKKVPELISSSLMEADYKVAVTAAWVCALYDPVKAEKFFASWLRHPNADVRVFAAAGLAMTGKYGEKIALKALKESNDPFVRVNIALGLFGQRVAVEQAADELYHFLMMQQKQLMRTAKSNPLFLELAPSNTRHTEKVSETPEALDQITRLELLRLLAVVEYPKTSVAIKRFLKEKNWGIMGIAATTLIEEGDEAAVDLVRVLLDDDDPKIRVQAALVIALWASDDKAVDILQSSYPSAGRDLKLQILEALGRIGARQSVPFLIDALQDPFALLRVIAASSLIICLNH